MYAMRQRIRISSAGAENIGGTIMRKCIGILVACLCIYGLAFAMGADDSASQKKSKNSVEIFS